MKHIFVLTAILAFLFAGCNQSTNTNSESHKHDAECNHASETIEQVKPAQESFTVKSDSGFAKKDSLTHKEHDGCEGHKKDHNEGKTHKH